MTTLEGITKEKFEVSEDFIILDNIKVDRNTREYFNISFSRKGFLGVLANLEYLTLDAIAQKPGEFVEFEYIYKTVWDDFNFREEKKYNLRIRHYLFTLREKIDQNREYINVIGKRVILGKELANPDFVEIGENKIDINSGLYYPIESTEFKIINGNKQLTCIELKIFESISKNPNKVVEYDDIYRFVWGDYKANNRIDNLLLLVPLGRVRRKLDPDKNYINSVKEKGIMFCPRGYYQKT